MREGSVGVTSTAVLRRGRLSRMPGPSYVRAQPQCWPCRLNSQADKCLRASSWGLILPVLRPALGDGEEQCADGRAPLPLEVPLSRQEVGAGCRGVSAGPTAGRQCALGLGAYLPSRGLPSVPGGLPSPAAPRLLGDAGVGKAAGIWDWRRDPEGPSSQAARKLSPATLVSPAGGDGQGSVVSALPPAGSDG